eukprot:3346132-Rhodomonas_salina.1
MSESIQHGQSLQEAEQDGEAPHPEEVPRALSRKRFDARRGKCPSVPSSRRQNCTNRCGYRAVDKVCASVSDMTLLRCRKENRRTDHMSGRKDQRNTETNERAIVGAGKAGDGTWGPTTVSDGRERTVLLTLGMRRWSPCK